MRISGYNSYMPYNISTFNNNISTLFGNQSSSVGGLSGLSGLSSLSSLSGLNGLSSLYGQQSSVDQASASYMQGIKTGAKEITSALADMKKAASTNAKAPTSSSGEHMSVSASSTSKFSGEMKVEIDQVASGQVNEGSALRANGSGGAVSGRQTFEIEMNGKRHRFNVDVKSTDTNEAIQKKMAQAINDANIGVTAAVQTDSKAGTSALSVQAKNTGDDDANRFELRDVTGSLASRMGVDKVTQDAQDAQDAHYRVNGGDWQTSKSNEVDLGQGVSATLRKATDEAVSVTMQRDTQGMQQGVRDMVESFNDLLKKADDNGGDRLSRELTNISKTYGHTLSKLGVEVDSDGYMKVNETRLNNAAQSGSLQKAIGEVSGASYGFENRLQRTASNIENNPSYYATQSMRQNSASELFGNYQTYTQNANLSYMLSQQQNLGMLFNWMG